jgi:hypothetical protein
VSQCLTITTTHSSSKTHRLATMPCCLCQLASNASCGSCCCCCCCCWSNCRWGSARGYRLQHTYSTPQVLPPPDKFGNSQGFAWSKYKVRQQQRIAGLMSASTTSNAQQLHCLFRTRMQCSA